MRKMRPRKNRDQWAAVIKQQSQSGLSVEALCEQHDKRLRDAAAKPLQKKY